MVIMKRQELYTPRHTANTDQEASKLRKLIGDIIGKETLPGRKYDKRLAAIAIATLALAGSVITGLAVNEIGSNFGETASNTAETPTVTRITTDPISLRTEVQEALKANGYNPEEITINLPDYAAEYQGQDPRKLDYLSSTYEITVIDGVANVTRLK